MHTSLYTSSSPDIVSAKPMKHHCDHQADCLKMIQLIIDGEATQQHLDKLRTNLENCRPCIEMYHLEKEIKQLMQDRMQKKCCPDQLITAIQAKISSFN
jgi:anti-sigma factor (TIGR02949 family)